MVSEEQNDGPFEPLNSKMPPDPERSDPSLMQSASLEDEFLNPDYWDWDSAETHPPVEQRGARIAVRVEGDDLKALLAAANAADMTVVEYVRTAALEKACAAQRAGSATR
jgi:hypothetical protein